MKSSVQPGAANAAAHGEASQAAAIRLQRCGEEAAAKDKCSRLDLADLSREPTSRLPGTGSRPNEGESRGIEVTRTGNTPDGSLMMTRDRQGGRLPRQHRPAHHDGGAVRGAEKVSDTFISLHYYSTWCAIVQLGSLTSPVSLYCHLPGTCPQERGAQREHAASSTGEHGQ